MGVAMNPALGIMTSTIGDNDNQDRFSWLVTNQAQFGNAHVKSP